jgi:hypothetical protein
MSKRKYKYNIEQIDVMFKERDYILLSKEFCGVKNYLEYVCNKHPGYVQKITFSDFLSGRGCWHCRNEIIGQKLALSFDYVNKKFTERNYKLISTVYNNNREKLKYQCNIHNEYIQEISYSNFSRGKGCKYCKSDKSRKLQQYPYEYVKSEFDNRDYLLISKEYYNNNTNLQYICLKHPDKIRNIRFGSLLLGQGCKQCAIERITGENHYNYNVNLTDEERIIKRDYKEYDLWTKDVFKRDDYTCQICGVRGKTINAHHLYNYADYPELRLEISNGVTLCEDCHKKFHKIYGVKNNTPEQFEQFKNYMLNEVLLKEVNVV